MTVDYTAFTISWFWTEMHNFAGGDSSAVRSQLVDVKDWPSNVSHIRRENQKIIDSKSAMIGKGICYMLVPSI